MSAFRGLRYHYSTDALLAVPEKQLVYKCGSKALSFYHTIKEMISREA